MNIFKKYFYCIFVLGIFLSACFDKTSVSEAKKNCTVDKIDSLIHGILHTNGVFAIIDTGKTTYLLVGNIVKPHKLYLIDNVYPVTTDYKDSIKRKDVNLIYFENCIINTDTNSIQLTVEFVATYTNPDSPPKQMNTKTSHFDFAFDEKKCKWILKNFDSDYVQ